MPPKRSVSRGGIKGPREAILLQLKGMAQETLPTIVSQLSTLLGGAGPAGQLNPLSSVLLKDRTAHRGSQL